MLCIKPWNWMCVSVAAANLLQVSTCCVSRDGILYKLGEMIELLSCFMHLSSTPCPVCNSSTQPSSSSTPHHRLSHQADSSCIFSSMTQLVFLDHCSFRTEWIEVGNWHMLHIWYDMGGYGSPGKMPPEVFHYLEEAQQKDCNHCILWPEYVCAQWLLTF